MVDIKGLVIVEESKNAHLLIFRWIENQLDQTYMPPPLLMEVI